MAANRPVSGICRPVSGICPRRFFLVPEKKHAKLSVAAAKGRPA